MLGFGSLKLGALALMSGGLLGAFKTGRRAQFRPDARSLCGTRQILERILKENIVAFWHPQVIDSDHGGYRLNHDLHGCWRGPANKSLVTQARTVWFFSRLANSAYRAPEYLGAARHGYEFLRHGIWDSEFGGFYWEVDSQGKRAIKPDKHLYGQAFGLFALAEYARASNDPAAAKLARELFELLERYAHDPQWGGYREFFSREWAHVPPDRRSYLNTDADIRSMNTHLHLLEAMTAFSSFSAVPLVKQRLTELMVVLSNTVVRKGSGACTDQHREDWTPLQTRGGRRVCYGHDVENVTLLIEACSVAGIAQALLLDLYRALFAHALRYGFDRKQGGFFYTGRLRRRADRLEKVWWVQAEGMLAALQMYCLTREKIYWECFAQTLQWILARQIDWKGGDWHDRIRRDGAPAGDKAGAWKGPYHNGRAVLRCLELLERLEEA